jgi:predicted house-cleaning NTP pyrophosphatase (Maf/HAM1 superfamily)
MKKQINPNIQAHLLQGTFYVLLLVTVCAIPFALGQRNATKPETPTKPSQRKLTFEERVINSIPPLGSVQEEWVARYDGPENANVATAIAIDGSGNVYVTGYSAGLDTDSDYATIKYNASGTQEWVARYNGPGNYSDGAAAIAVDSSGNVYVTGTSASQTGYDYATVKYDASGAEQWVARYNAGSPEDNGATAIAVDSSGNVYVTGKSVRVDTGYDYTTVKYDVSGKEQWVARYTGPGDRVDSAAAIAIDGTGNVFVTGMSAGVGTGYDYATIKYNNSGQNK